MKKLNICIYGAASQNLDESYLRDGIVLGVEIGRRGHNMIYGAGSTGLMGAVAQGAYQMGAKITGVVPHFMKKFELLYEKCSEIIFTETMAERKEIMENRSDAFIICPGGIGTMDEFFQILTLKSLEKSTAPIVLYNTKGIYDKLIAFIDDGIREGFIQKEVRNQFMVSTSPIEILDYLENKQ